MSAAEIIEQIKALSPEEQREVSRFVRELAASDRSSGAETPTVRYATDDQARAAGDAVVAEYPETFRRLAE
jgi:hypothetical protein